MAVSGEVDLVTDGATVAHVHGGSHFMSEITGSGCSLGGVIAVYETVADPFTAALAGVAIYDVAGMRREEKAEGPASFKVAFIDALATVPAEDVAACEMEFEEA